MNFVKQSTFTLSLIFAAAFSAATDFEFSFGLGLSDEPVAGVAQYGYSDGSTKTLTAGNGLGIMVHQTITSLKGIDLSAGAGLQWGAISDDTTSTSYKDRFSYLPVELNASYDISNELALKGGISHLLMPTYSIKENNDELKITGTSNIGFNVSVQYNLKDGYFFVKYSSNKVEYKEGQFNDDAPTDLTGVIDDEIVNVIHVGLGASF